MENVCGCFPPLSFSISYSSTSSNCVATWNNGQCDSCDVESWCTVYGCVSSHRSAIMLMAGIMRCGSAYVWPSHIQAQGLLRTFKIPEPSALISS